MEAETTTAPPKRPVGRPRKPVNADETKYMLENIPRDLWLRAKAKAIEEEAGPMKAVLLALLRAWVEA